MKKKSDVTKHAQQSQTHTEYLPASGLKFERYISLFLFSVCLVDYGFHVELITVII